MSLTSMQGALLGTRLTLWLGPVIAVPAPPTIVEALISVQVTLSDEGPDGFQLTFAVGRSGLFGLDYDLQMHPLLQPFRRVIVQVWNGVMPQVLIDGFITNRNLSVSNEPGQSTLTVTGEDVRVIMDLREVSVPYPQSPVQQRIQLILSKYLNYLSAPIVLPGLPPVAKPITENVPLQSETDLEYINRMGEDYDYVFYVEPTPVPNINLAYWGPENRLSIPQSALSVNMGGDTNVESLNFTYDGLAPTTVLGAIQDKRIGAIFPIITLASLRPPLALMPAHLVQQPYVRSQLARDMSALDLPEALSRAQAITERSTSVVRAEGTLDMMRYGDILRPRRLVGVRGAGFTMDGFYYVKSVTHNIKHGEYTQDFTLEREGTGAISPVVIP